MATNKQSLTSIEAAGGAIFGGLSLLVSSSAGVIPRLSWGIALIDPISFVWIACFLIFGFRSGIICSVAGTVGLMFFDPTRPYGPFLKLCATLPMMLIPLLALKIMKRNTPYSGHDLNSPKLWFPASAIAIPVRIAIMIPINLAIVPIMFPEVEFAVQAIIIFTVIINAVQSALDAIIPWFLVVPTKIYERYGSQVW